MCWTVFKNKREWYNTSVYLKNEQTQLKIRSIMKESYSDIIIPRESYHPYRYKMAAINSFCYRAQKCLKETESKDRELKTIKGIVRNNN